MVSGLNVKEGNGMQTKQKSYKGLIYILLVLLSLFMLVPFYWMVISSLKLNKDVFSIPMIVSQHYIIRFIRDFLLDYPL